MVAYFIIATDFFWGGGVVMALSRLLPWHLPGETEGSHESHCPEQEMNKVPPKYSISLSYRITELKHLYHIILQFSTDMTLKKTI
jgi:hypothetical protein